MVAETESVVQKSSSEKYALYKGLFATFHQVMNDFEKEADSVSLNTNAAIHAITSPSPKTRYVLGSSKGISLSTFRMILPFLSDRVQDGLKVKTFKV